MPTSVGSTRQLQNFGMPMGLFRFVYIENKSWDVIVLLCLACEMLQCHVFLPVNSVSMEFVEVVMVVE